MILAQKNVVMFGPAWIPEDQSFQICPDNLDQISRALSALFIGLGFRVRDVLADMILDQFHRETIYGASNRCNEIEYLAARSLVFQSPLDGFELPFKSPDARQQLFIGLYVT